MAKRKSKTPKILRKNLWDEMSIYYRTMSAADGSETHGNCFTCNQLISLKHETDLGHGYPKGGYEFHRFNPNNLRIQCRSCNLGKQGEQVEFMKKLRLELGNEVVNEMHAHRKDVIKRGTAWYKNEIAWYKELNKQLPFKLSDNTE